MDKAIKEAYEYGTWYMDGSLYVVLIDGQPSESVRIGIGDTPEEAVDNLETTAIQCTGRTYINSALQWAYYANWISDPETLEEIEIKDHI